MIIIKLLLGFTQPTSFKTVYKDKFINQKTLLSSNKIYTKDSTDYYVPVKFFGQYNSNLKKK